MSIGFVIALQIILIILNAIFASAEIAVLSINETKLERMAQEGNKKAKRLFGLTREPAKFLSTIQVAITLSGFLGSAFAADSFSELLVEWVIGLGVPVSRDVLDPIAVVVITLILSYFTLVFGELVPKRLAMKRSESIAMGISGILKFISVVFKPVVWFLSASTNVVLRLCGVDPHEAEDEVSEEEIRMMVDAGSEKGTIDLQEKEFIQKVFEFNDITAGDIATHRTEVCILWMEDDDEVWWETVHSTRHTLYPICDGSSDNIVGILNAKDYFRLEKRDRNSVIENAVQPAYFVPETIKADVLFRNMKATRNPMAVVIDEYGGMEGILTINDLVEELVGDLIQDPEEEGNPSPTLEQTGDLTWQVRGNVSLEELEEVTGLVLSCGDYDTLTGMVFDKLGVIPEDGAHDLSVELDFMEVTVKSIISHQIEHAVVVLKKIQDILPTEEGD